MNIHAQRIEALRSLMASKGWDAVIVTGSDPHCSECPAPRWKQVEWLTGFTGEAGDVVITPDHAGLWTDTRYFIQAVRQLDGTGVELHKTRVPEQVLIPEWLGGRLAPDSIIALDGLCQNAGDVDELKSICQVVSVPDMLGSLWQDRPGIPQTPIFEVEAGESRAEKITWLREVVGENGCEAILLSALDDIAWMLNVRASDIEYNPFVISYLLVSAESVKWFVLKGEVEDADTEETLSKLRSEDIEILPYADVELYLDDFDPLWFDAGSANFQIAGPVRKPSPVQRRKAVKNEFEIEGMRRAHLLDGVVMEKFLYWLEKSVKSGARVTEWDAAAYLGRLRDGIDGYHGDSFETISAYGEGAALPHYITPKTDAPELLPEGLYLNDSGGQFEFGTTDITRTIPLGPCSELEREDYTLVLKSHIAVEMAVFPEGTPGCRIDALAREPLWRAHRNFGHGTGHGVGFFLGVHEGPHDMRQNLNGEVFEPGMLITDEPGIYREGMHGIRHENVLLCVDDGSDEFGRWLKFEPLTLCHFDTAPIVRELLSPDEIGWLNAYNALVLEKLSPLLPPEVAEWLERKCEAI